MQTCTTGTSHAGLYDDNKELETFNYYQKMLHHSRLSSPISNTVNMKYLVSKYAIKTGKRRKKTGPLQ